MKKVIIIITLFVCSCSTKKQTITRKERRYIDSVCNLPHLEQTIKAQREQINSINVKADREKELKRREQNTTIIRNN